MLWRNTSGFLLKQPRLSAHLSTSMAYYPPVDKLLTESETPLLSENGTKAPVKRTPLPKLQFAILLLVQLSEPMAGSSIFPYINQACFIDSDARSILHCSEVDFRAWYNWRRQAESGLLRWYYR